MWPLSLRGEVGGLSGRATLRDWGKKSILLSFHIFKLVCIVLFRIISTILNGDFLVAVHLFLYIKFVCVSIVCVSSHRHYIFP